MSLTPTKNPTLGSASAHYDAGIFKIYADSYVNQLIFSVAITGFPNVLFSVQASTTGSTANLSNPNFASSRTIYVNGVQIYTDADNTNGTKTITPEFVAAVNLVTDSVRFFAQAVTSADATPPNNVQTATTDVTYTFNAITNPITIVTTNNQYQLLYLPPASTVTGKFYFVKNLSGGSRGIYTTSNEMIDDTQYSISIPNRACVCLVSNGINWYIVSYYQTDISGFIVGDSGATVKSYSEPITALDLTGSTNYKFTLPNPSVARIIAVLGYTRDGTSGFVDLVLGGNLQDYPAGFALRLQMNNSGGNKFGAVLLISDGSKWYIASYTRFSQSTLTSGITGSTSITNPITIYSSPGTTPILLQDVTDISPQSAKFYCTKYGKVVGTGGITLQKSGCSIAYNALESITKLLSTSDYSGYMYFLQNSTVTIGGTPYSPIMIPVAQYPTDY